MERSCLNLSFWGGNSNQPVQQWLAIAVTIAIAIWLHSMPYVPWHCFHATALLFMLWHCSIAIVFFCMPLLFSLCHNDSICVAAFLFVQQHYSLCHGIFLDSATFSFCCSITRPTLNLWLAQLVWSLMHSKFLLMVHSWSPDLLLKYCVILLFWSLTLILAALSWLHSMWLWQLLVHCQICHLIWLWCGQDLCRWGACGVRVLSNLVEICSMVALSCLICL